MLVSAKAVWSLSSLRNTHLRVWVFCRTQANVQHFSAVWKLSLAGARKDDLNLGVVFSSLQSTAPGVINDGLGGDRHPGTQTASLTLSLAISLWRTCMGSAAASRSGLWLHQTSLLPQQASENQSVPHAPLTHSRLWWWREVGQLYDWKIGM